MSEGHNEGPLQTIRDGAVVVKLWRHEGQNGSFVSATLGRTFQNKQTGEYGESRSLSGTDVLKAQALLIEANREMIRWRDFFREEAREMGEEQAEMPGLKPEPENAPETSVSAPQTVQGLLAHRDEVIAKAKPSKVAEEPGCEPER